MNTFSKMWKITTPKEAKEIIEKQRKEYGVPNPVNLEEQAINLVGKDIYEKLIRGYTMKQWGVDPKKLPPSIIKRLPVRYTYDNNYFNDYYQGIPEKGYTALVENMIKGIDLTLNADYFDNKSVYDELAEKIVYTGPIDRFFDYRFGRLGYRSLRFEHELLPIANFQGNAVVNYTDFAIPIQESSNINSLRKMIKKKPSSPESIQPILQRQKNPIIRSTMSTTQEFMNNIATKVKIIQTSFLAAGWPSIATMICIMLSRVHSIWQICLCISK